MTQFEKSVIDSLTTLGFTQNEAKIYLYLVENPNSNGYEISKNTGISRSMVYGSLEKLRSSGFIDLTQSSSSSYVPKTLDEIEHYINYNVSKAITNLKENLPKVQSSKNEDLFITIPDSDNQVKKMTYMVKSAKQFLYIAAGTRELRWIKEDLYALPEHIKVYLHSFADISAFSDRFEVYSRSLSTENIQEIDSLRNIWRILIIKDNDEMLLCGGDQGHTGTAIYTRNEMMVTFAVEHFMHDVQLYNIQKKHGITDESHLDFPHITLQNKQ
jgi:sugar-specific transcriptional regulator TrmB